MKATKRLFVTITIALLLTPILTAVASEDFKMIIGDTVYVDPPTHKSIEQLSNKTTHTVVKGDTLYSLSRIYNTTVDELQRVNQLHSTLIIIGQTLKLPNGDVSNKIQVASTNPVKQVNQQKKEEPASSSVASSPNEQPTKTLQMEATAYTAYCEGCSGITKTGINLRKNPNLKVIAVDPNVIPLGSKVYVEGYGEAIAGDIGGAIKGNKIDVFIPTTAEAYSWGRRTVTVTIY